MRLAASLDGAAAAAVGGALVLVDASGARVREHGLGSRALSVARFGDEWLVLADKQKHLARVGPGSGLSSFAAGKGPIAAFAVGRDDAVAVARKETLELWSRDDERRWSNEGGPFTRAAVARDHVVALGEDGALCFFSRDGGEPLGALRLASPEPVAAWRLERVDGAMVVLALGEWLVWIDAATRKTIRRVRAQAKVVELAADAEYVVAAVEDGPLQAFRAATGEPRASLGAGEAAVRAIALGPGALFALRGDKVRVVDRSGLGETARAASPVSALAARGALAVAGDRTGRVRIFDVSGRCPSEVAAIAGSEATVGLFVTKSEAVVLAGARVTMRAPRPWSSPRPAALREAATAFAADEAYAFTGSQAGNVDVHDLAAGRQVTTYALSDDRVTALLRLPGALLVVGTGALDGRVLFVDVAEAKVVHRASPHEEAFAVTCLASDARGRIVASGGDDGSIALLDPAKGRVLARLRVPETPVSIAFEPAGKRLACVFGDGTAAMIGFSQKSATISDLGVRGATCVAWGARLVFGFKDGRVEDGDRHARPSDRPGTGERA